MEPVSHIASFYLLGKRAKIKKLWVGMITSILPDASLFLFVWVGPLIGLNVAIEMAWMINLFLHSVFALLLLLPIAFFSFRYFYAALTGYSFHLFLDYLTHTAIRMPFFPLTTWKVPIFLISYFDPIFVLLTNGVILVLILIFDGKRLITLFKNLLNNFKKGRVWLFTILYVIVTSIFAIWYTEIVININSDLFFLCSPLIAINLVFIGILFFIEVDSDEKTSGQFRKAVGSLLGQVNRKDIYHIFPMKKKKKYP